MKSNYKRLYTNYCSWCSILIVYDKQKNPQFYVFFCIILKVSRLLIT